MQINIKHFCFCLQVTSEPSASAQSEPTFTGNKKKPQGKLICPVCESTVVHMPRHLRQKHLYSESSSRMYREDFKIANSFRHINTCLVPQCGFRTARIDKHLKKGHKLSIEEMQVYCRIERARSSSKRKEIADRERVSSM